MRDKCQDCMGWITLITQSRYVGVCLRCAERINKAVIYKQKVDPQVFKEISMIVCAQLCIKENLIRGRTRKKPYPEARARIARELYSKGYSYSAIGRALIRDHTTVMYMVDPEYRQRMKKSNGERAYENYKRRTA